MGTGQRDVIWAPSAYADLDQALARREDAAALLEEVLDAAASLSTLSERGRLVPELDDTREIFVRDFRLMYEVSSTHVLIVAFVYGHRHGGGDPRSAECECAETLASRISTGRARIHHRRARGPGPCSSTHVDAGSDANDEKVALFRQLFQGREDVFPIRFESKKGSPDTRPHARTSSRLDSATCRR